MVPTPRLMTLTSMTQVTGERWMSKLKRKSLLGQSSCLQNKKSLPLRTRSRRSPYRHHPRHLRPRHRLRILRRHLTCQDRAMSPPRRRRPRPRRPRPRLASCAAIRRHPRKSPPLDRRKSRHPNRTRRRRGKLVPVATGSDDPLDRARGRIRR